MDYDRTVCPPSVLHWNYRGFTEFPLHKLDEDESSDVTDIYLKENLISRLPSEIMRLEKLESLYLSGNDITELPVEISKLSRLKCLDISGNRLRWIPEEIGDVCSLKFLILDDNELSALPLRLAELRALRYLSVCDNRLRWLPQRPVYNYHHCEFRFWRNSNLNTIPYSLWYHMLRDQQTRSLNIGCLNVPQYQHQLPNGRFRLKLSYENRIWEVDIDCLPHHATIAERTSNNPPTLLELSKRRFYAIIYNTAKDISNDNISIYSDAWNSNRYDEENNNNITNLEMNFNGIDIDEDDSIRDVLDNDVTCDLNGNECVNNDQVQNNQRDLRKSKSYTIQRKKERKKSYYAPADIIDEYFDYLPMFIKSELYIGPASKCENVQCRAPIFDFITYEFCLGKIVLIDNTEEVILSASFCSQSCANVWKGGKTNLMIPWTLTTQFT